MPLIAILPGDGIGPEVTGQAVRVLEAMQLGFAFEEGLVGAAAYSASGIPLPGETLALVDRADAVLFGAVGDPDYEGLERDMRPQSAMYGIRRYLRLFANLRPARLFPGLEDRSVLRPEIAAAIDLMIVREFSGDIYFGEKGRGRDAKGLREGHDLMRYDEIQIARLVRTAFEISLRRGKSLVSIDKANVLETSALWREVVNEVARDYPEVELAHMYADSAAMQLVRDPGQFDTIVTSNLFGDIFSDLAAMLCGSIGMLPSASLNEDGKGLYEPVHGAAPDIAGDGVANPCGAILSAAMMLRYSFHMTEESARLAAAVIDAIAKGARTEDLGGKLSTAQMGEAILAELGA